MQSVPIIPKIWWPQPPKGSIIDLISYFWIKYLTHKGEKCEYELQSLEILNPLIKSKSVKSSAFLLRYSHRFSIKNLLIIK